LTFVNLSRSRITDKLVFKINWQNFARVGLQLKFVFTIWPLELEIDSKKVIDYGDKSIFDKREVENNAIDYDYRSIVLTLVLTYMMLA